MANNVTFHINLKVDGKDIVKQVTMNVDELRNAIDSTRTATEQASVTFINMNQHVEMFRNMAEGVSQLASTLNNLTEESRQYSAAMAAANTMAGKSGEDFANLKNQVSELAKTIPIARDQLANGLYQVISNGVPEDNWIEYLNQSAKASVGGIADLEEVVKVTSTVIKNYGLSWQDAGTIQDKIQLTAKNGVTSFEQMAQALPRVTANAATLGVTVDELMATFATLTGVSGNTAEVSTQLAAIFTALVKPSSEATEMAQQMGIQFDAAAVKAAGGMQNFIQSLDRDVKNYAASSGMLEQEIYGKLFGSAESLRALIPLTGELADKFSQNVDEMQGSAGTIDGAFDTMGNTGAAQLQKLKNAFAGIGDTLSGAVGWFQPVLNFGSQAGMTAVSVLALRNAFSGLNITTRLASAATAAFGPIIQVCRATMTGAAVSAETLRLAIRGLMITTGVGIAVAALTEIINHFASSNDNAANSASRMASAEQQAADAVKSAYDNTLQQTYSSLMSQYDRLKDSYNALKTTHEKTEWLKNNKSAFDDLRIKVNGISDAENIFKNNTTAVAQAFERRAKAAAYAAQLVELYKQQLELSNRKKTADAAILAATNQYNHSTATSNQDNPYATENAKRNANLAGIAADMKNGGDGNLAKVNEQLNATNKKIEETRKAMNELGEDKIIDGGSAGSGSGNTTTTTSPAATITPKSDEPDPIEGSIDWYEKQLSTLRTQINATANEGVAKTKQAEYNKIEGQLKDYKIRIGVEETPKEEAKTVIQELYDDLQEAQEGFDNAVTVDAKVKAKAKVDEIQAKIDEATNGKLSIQADVTPSYIVQGSVDDKRQSYSNAQSKANRIQQDFEIGLIGKDEAQKELEDLNKQITALDAKLKPLKIEVDSKSFEKAMGKIKNAWGSVQSIGSGIQNITDALSGNKDAWSAISGVINGFISIAEGVQGVVKIVNLLTNATNLHTTAEATKAVAVGASNAAETSSIAANTAAAAATAPVIVANQLATASFLEMAAASYFAAHAYIPFAGAGIASGFAAQAVAETKAIGALAAFARGGIVGGSSISGDKLLVRVNSGEMILNAAQQARLFALANGAAYQESAQVQSAFARGSVQPLVEVDAAKLQSIGNGVQPNGRQRVNFRLKARELVGSIANETRWNSRRSNIKI